MACLEAKFVPTSDSNLKCELFKDGLPLEHANRISIFFGFGYVSLKIHHLNAQRDSGVYEAVISNRVGTEKVSTRLNVTVKSLERDTEYDEGLRRIQQLESSTKYKREEYEEIEIQEKPKFLTPLQGSPDSLLEGDHLHLESKLIPLNDPSMKVEFFFNNQLLSVGHRFKTFYEFGIVAVDILSLIPEDSGVLSVRAINNYGEDLVSKRITVRGKQAIDSTKMFDVNIDQVRMIRNEQIAQSKEMFDDPTRKKPILVQPLTLRTKNPHVERSDAHFDARIEHSSEELKIEFFHNGVPLLAGSRVLIRNDFSLISLDIRCLTLSDPGEYTLVVSNALGYVSSSAHLEVIGESNIISSSQFPESLDKLQYLEGHSKYVRKDLIEEISEKIVFIQPLTLRTKNPHIERSSAHFDARIEGYSNSTLRYEFFHDDRPVLTGSRLLTSNNFGVITLDISALHITDSGKYTLVVSTEDFGSISSSANLEVIEESSIISSSQFPESLDKIQYIEGHNKYSRKEIEDLEFNEKPHFLTPMADQRIPEFERAHFESRLEPVNDPSMQIQFLKNGQPIEKANRISTTDNFGFVSIDIRQCTKEVDEGYYEVIARNKIGEARVGARLEVIPTKNIISDHITDDPSKIHYLENQQKYVREEIEDAGPEKPFFLEPLRGPDVLWEGQSAHFETRFRPVSDPSLQVAWFFNDKQLQLGHRLKTYFNFGFVSLDLLYVYPEDTGHYSVKIFNELGEAVTGKDLLVKAVDSIDRTKNYDVEIDKIREAKMKRKEEEEIITSEAPIFITQIQDQIVDERETARFEANLTPQHDNKLCVQWYLNGELMKAANRIRTFHNFGVVWCEILDCLKRGKMSLINC